MLFGDVCYEIGRTSLMIINTPPWSKWIGHRTTNPKIAGSNPVGGIVTISMFGEPLTERSATDGVALIHAREK